MMSKHAPTLLRCLQRIEAASQKRPQNVRLMPDEKQLLEMSRSELDALFGNADSGPIPNGRAAGTAILLPGSPYNATVAQLVRTFAWQGKTFYAKYRVLTNRVSPLGLSAAVAVVYEEPSLLDGRACIVLDYSKTSLAARFVRDEIRLIAPSLYLGKAYWSRWAVCHFALRF
jgi:hypothetical protein